MSAEESAEQRFRRRLERERRIRLEAERLSEHATRALYDRGRDLELLEAVATTANAASEIAEAARATIDRVCGHTGWPAGHLLEVGDDGAVHSTGVWHVDPPERFAALVEGSAQRTFAHGVGLPGAVAASGSPVWIADVADDPEFVRAEFARQAGVHAAFAFPVLVGREVVGVLEFFSLRPSDPDAQLLAVMAQVGTQLGRVVERERAEERLRALNAELFERAAELDRSNADLEAFASVVSHDLSEPLATVVGFMELLERRHGEALDDEAREYVGLAMDGGRRMRRLIDDLLEISRAGRARLELVPVDLAELARTTVLELDARVRASGATVTFGDLPAVRGDRSQLARVLLNLVGNALKFGARRVEVGARLDEDAVEVAVRDDGRGIAPEDAERIFGMFTQGRARRGSEGMGIGLAICRTIVERHGGRIWVEPAARGADVRFRLPAAQLAEVSRGFSTRARGR